MQDYISSADGFLVDAGSTTECQFCPISNTDNFLGVVNIFFENRWRDWGILWAFIVFNIVVATFLYWLARVPKNKKTKKE